MATWHRVLLTALMGAAFTYACTIKEGDDDEFDEDDEDNTPRAGQGVAGSRAGSGGSAAGAGGSRAGAGGTGGAAGGRGGAGGAGAGGDDGVEDDVSCDGAPGKAPADSCTDFEDIPGRYVECLSCLASSCCDEVKGCYSENPHDACGWGVAQDGANEYFCYIECLIKRGVDSGILAYDDQVDPAECADFCAIRTDGVGAVCRSPLIADSTNELNTCTHANCEVECIGDLIEQDDMDAP